MKLKQNRLALFVILSAVFLCPALSYPAITYGQIGESLDGSVLAASTASNFPFPSNSLVNDGGTIYFICGSSKIPFTNYQAFVGLGYTLDNVVNGSLANYTAATQYFLTTANMEHPWCSWLLNNGTVYYSHQSGLIAVPSWEVFLNNGGQSQYIVNANSYDLAALNTNPNLPILQDNDPRVYLTPGSTTVQATTPGALPTTLNDYVSYLFSCVTGNQNPDPDSYNFWLNSQLTVPEFYTYFYGYNSYLPNLTDQQFINNIYSCALFRAPTSSELAAALSGPLDRYSLVESIISSSEFTNRVQPVLAALQPTAAGVSSPTASSTPPTATSTTPAAGDPAITLTANGSSGTYNMNVGDSIKYAWSASNADSLSGTMTGGPDYQVATYPGSPNLCANSIYLSGDLWWLDPFMQDHGSIADPAGQEIPNSFNIPLSGSYNSGAYQAESAGAATPNGVLSQQTINDCGSSRTYVLTMTATQSSAGKTASASVTVKVPGAPLTDMWYAAQAASQTETNLPVNWVVIQPGTSSSLPIYVTSEVQPLSPTVTVTSPLMAGQNTQYQGITFSQLSSQDAVFTPAAQPLNWTEPNNVYQAQVGTLKITLPTSIRMPEFLQLSTQVGSDQKSTTIYIFDPQSEPTGTILP